MSDQTQKRAPKTRKPKARKYTRRPKPPLMTLPPSGKGYAREPTVLGIFQISQPTLWRWIGDGVFPKPHLIGPRMNGWDLDELREHMTLINNGTAPHQQQNK